MIERVGPLQLILLERARLARSRMIMTGGFLEARACRRLAERDLLKRVDTNVEPHWYRRKLGHKRPEYYVLTPRGEQVRLLPMGGK